MANSDSEQQALAQAFQAFNELSTRLTGSYRELEQRVERLSRELASARDQRLAELAEKERLANRLSHLLAALPAGVVVLDAHGVVQTANPTATRLLGSPLEGIRWTTIYARAVAASSGADGELELHGGRRVTLSSCDLGQEPGRIVVLQDVTEARALQALADRQQRLSAMGEMAASLAHQIRTPLASALLYVGHLSARDLGSADRERIAGRIGARLRHLEQLVQDMLSFVRGDPRERGTLAVAELVEPLRQGLAPQIDALGARLDCRAGNAPPVRAQRETLLGALNNLVTNALQAAGAGARVSLCIDTAADGRARITVHDDGPGIPAALAERIFEPFFTTRAQGTGLGLAVVREVVRSHGGEITLAPGQGAGATFIIHLPPAGRDMPLAGRWTDIRERQAIEVDS